MSMKWQLIVEMMEGFDNNGNYKAKLNSLFAYIDKLEVEKGLELFYNPKDIKPTIADSKLEGLDVLGDVLNLKTRELIEIGEILREYNLVIIEENQFDVLTQKGRDFCYMFKKRGGYRLKSFGNELTTKFLPFNVLHQLLMENNLKYAIRKLGNNN
jgi:hypothetical protein